MRQKEPEQKFNAATIIIPVVIVLLIIFVVGIIIFGGVYMMWNRTIQDGGMTESRKCLQVNLEIVSLNLEENNLVIKRGPDFLPDAVEYILFVNGEVKMNGAISASEEKNLDISGFIGEGETKIEIAPKIGEITCPVDDEAIIG